MISFEDTENQLMIYVREFDAKNQNLITKYIKELVDKQKNGVFKMCVFLYYWYLRRI